MSASIPFHTWVDDLSTGVLRLSEWDSQGSEVRRLVTIRLAHVSAVTLKFGSVNLITLHLTSGAKFEVVANPEDYPDEIVDLFDRLETSLW